MKIQCDVCSKSEAAVFCTADEAALCGACDQRVHHANKLASKHHRFSLLHPNNPAQFPLCDICQEKRGLLFCQQDRAILCRDCDIPIHSANELTMKHTRFLLTGLKLQDQPSLIISSSSPDRNHNNNNNKKKNIPNNKQINVSIISGEEDQSTPFSISEYLIETLPGWHVEDFLDTSNNNNNSSSSLFGFSKITDESGMFEDCDLDDQANNHKCENNTASNNMGIWVPQAPSLPLVYPSSEEMASKPISFNYDNATARRWSVDDGSFTVPQINLPSVGSKRSRAFW